ncbi:cytochrome d ubiquinol oxidase subunit I [Methylobacterium sp. PvP062]|jgi:cytochrome bd ubiquinol oxidase subunit I|uniref:Cytochrome bd ubiquinol oxidase subunit I n=2 Tax=Methylobacterium radiotolerans TaxID=31998 RepID=B1LSV0_METRJ|nr:MULTISPECIES: cytochrome ubiquinol oxidase subunit I [Methylobacterium]MCX7334901.1 cytochrome ubiquinol oxidase subunit I [Hyphomicrobiales bacterium]GAN49747.1 cytochrome bd ubiquinol oxidase subunit I [Methylobacterium sp. ME121]ACB26821.1 cytochrome bd ubiquinol oxidase subunit I [Methylobacterium radiotolerans JCM 2831]KIU28501.1 cytochrome D ubiquinol oxidase subunit I [Methylobacterium radiotolerans]MBN6822190.1 cytochrome ubiquinol oxidase subunit I [Methylobacterium organophilum]
MDISALMLSRIQFAFTVSFHIIFPAFTVGLAAWLAFLQARAMISGEPVYDRLFDFWLKIFAVAFGLGVVSGIVMAFQFGTNWSELARRTGPIQGPLLGYESFTAFALEASFFGVLMFGRRRVPRWFYLFACLMVCLGTSLSSFWILVNNSWMQYPTGFALRPDGVFVPTDWWAIIFNGVVWVRFPHMVLAAYVTTSFCVAATGAWSMLRGRDRAEARAMVRMGLGLAAVLVPLQLFFGHLTGDYVVKHQPSKIAAIEGHWESRAPAGEILFAWPDEAQEKNHFVIALPAPAGSLIDDGTLTGKVIGIKDIPKADRPPVLIPFFAFRIMVGCGLLMLALAWGGIAFYATGRLERARWLQWAIFLSFPLGFVATLTGWFTAEVGRQPWTVYGQLRTADAATPFLTSPQVATSLAVFGAVYALIFAAGTVYIYRMLRAGILPTPAHVGSAANPKRPLAVPGNSPGTPSSNPAE